jgi:protein-S-isoprenylcysteine O-methyltransferase Ste14
MILQLYFLKICLSPAISIILISGTIFIVLFSWFLSIKFRRYHGIARFFAFESVFILVLLNYKVWFITPFSVQQILSWILLIYSAYIAVAGYLTLKRKGKPDSNFENTSVLVKSGLYYYIRHPLYLSIFLLGSGVMLKHMGIVQLSLGAVNLIAIYLTARIEEKEMIVRFGDEYRDYMNETKMFIPFLL